MNFLQRRRVRKQLGMLIKQAGHVRNSREDVASADDLKRLDEAERLARAALAGGDMAAADACAAPLEKSIMALIPRRSCPGLRDNLEMLIVAVAVAMAFRTYFVQPFKIPTSSMYPTLYGITYQAKPAPTFADSFPVKLLKWAVLGEWFVNIKARTSGEVVFARNGRGERDILVGGVPHDVPRNAALHVSHGDRVFAGQPIASAVRGAGDHILVNKVIWNFRRPGRGEIMVFKTDGIKHPQIKRNEHYVKRLVGLPGEKLAIVEPFIEIDGVAIDAPAGIRRLQDYDLGYSGYKKAGTLQKLKDGSVQLGPDDFFACGDNQLSSLDSRYWGPVPRANLVGPAFFIYWPFSKRWGHAD